MRLFLVALLRLVLLALLVLLVIFYGSKAWFKAKEESEERTRVEMPQPSSMVVYVRVENGRRENIPVFVSATDPYISGAIFTNENGQIVLNGLKGGLYYKVEHFPPANCTPLKGYTQTVLVNEGSVQPVEFYDVCRSLPAPLIQEPPIVVPGPVIVQPPMIVPGPMIEQPVPSEKCGSCSCDSCQPNPPQDLPPPVIATPTVGHSIPNPPNF